MVVHSGLYIPVSSRIHPSQLDLVIIIPVLALTRTCESVLPLKCAGTKPVFPLDEPFCKTIVF